MLQHWKALHTVYCHKEQKGPNLLLKYQLDLQTILKDKQKPTDLLPHNETHSAAAETTPAVGLAGHEQQRTGDLLFILGTVHTARSAGKSHPRPFTSPYFSKPGT